MVQGLMCMCNVQELPTFDVYLNVIEWEQQNTKL